MERAAGSPDRDRTCCLLGRSQVLCPDELRGHGNGWPGRGRTDRSPRCRRGCPSAERQANSCRARTRTWTDRGNNPARCRRTPRGSRGEGGARTLASAVRRPTWIAARPRHQTWVPLRERRERELNCRWAMGQGPCARQGRTAVPGADGRPCTEGAGSATWPSPGWPPRMDQARAEGLEPPTNPALETGALPLSYARVGN